MKAFVGNVLAIFLLLTIVFFPLRLQGLDVQLTITSAIFKTPVSFIANSLFAGKVIHVDFSSDSYTMLFLLGILLLLAIVISIFVGLRETRMDKFFAFARAISVAYISFILFRYGFDKIFQQQFYAPEPNILYTDFGNLDKDILYWSTMGTSRFYTVFLGSAEVLAGSLLLIRRTRVLGLFLALAILVNVFAVNIGFDISVKLFSGFLIFATLFASWPYVKSLKAFFISQVLASLPEFPTVFQRTFLFVWLGVFGKFMIVAIAFYPFLSSGNMSGAMAYRREIHGAYRVRSVVVSDSILHKMDFPYRRVFIHRDNYLILQDRLGNMHSLEIIAQEKSDFILQGEDGQKQEVSINLNPGNGILTLYLRRSKTRIEAKSLDWRNVPALKDETHFLIEDIP